MLKRLTENLSGSIMELYIVIYIFFQICLESSYCFFTISKMVISCDWYLCSHFLLYLPTGCLEMTEHAVVRLVKRQQKWVMCPTCRQHTDFRNIAYVDDKLSKVYDSKVPNLFRGENLAENSLKVEGSYGTKVCLHIIVFPFI